MSQNVLEKHQNLRAALDPTRSLTDGARIWNEAFCEVYDELERYVKVVEHNHAVKAAWEEFVADTGATASSGTLVYFLAYLIRKAHTLVPPDNSGN